MDLLQGNIEFLVPPTFLAHRTGVIFIKQALTYMSHHTLYSIDLCSTCYIPLFGISSKDMAIVRTGLETIAEGKRSAPFLSQLRDSSEGCNVVEKMFEEFVKVYIRTVYRCDLIISIACSIQDTSIHINSRQS